MFKKPLHHEHRINFDELNGKISQQQKEIEKLKEELNYTTSLLQNTINIVTESLVKNENKMTKLSSLMKNYIMQKYNLKRKNNV